MPSPVPEVDNPARGARNGAARRYSWRASFRRANVAGVLGVALLLAGPSPLVELSRAPDDVAGTQRGDRATTRSQPATATPISSGAEPSSAVDLRVPKRSPSVRLPATGGGPATPSPGVGSSGSAHGGDPGTATPAAPAGQAARARTLAPERLTGYQWPLRNARIHGFFDFQPGGSLAIAGRRLHDGLDLSTFCGDSIRAAHSGTVLYAGRNFDPYLGYVGPLDDFYARLGERGGRWLLPIVVVIDDGNGYRSVYVHLWDTAVRKGEIVRAGRVIGREGATGNASGCHLHYSLVRMDGPWMTVAPKLVRKLSYPPLARERVDPLRVLSLEAPYAPRLVPGIVPPRVSPGVLVDQRTPEQNTHFDRAALR